MAGLYKQRFLTFYSSKPPPYSAGWLGSILEGMASAIVLLLPGVLLPLAASQHRSCLAGARVSHILACVCSLLARTADCCMQIPAEPTAEPSVLQLTAPDLPQRWPSMPPLCRPILQRLAMKLRAWFAHLLLSSELLPLPAALLQLQPAALCLP